MIADETDVRAFLSRPENFGLCGPVELIETHISLIALVGDRAFKMKRPVKLPYVDFSTPARRIEACEAEVALNSLTAPGLYLHAHRLTRGFDGRLKLGGEGELADGIIEMRRFDQALLFDRMAEAGRLTPKLMTRTARMIAAVHRQAPVVCDGAGAARVAQVLSINRAGFATSSVFSPDEVDALDAAFRHALKRVEGLLDRRSAAGRVRRCHGDLHLRNICLLDGEPRLFDCIEFNPALATTDVLYDLAFLLMDLWHSGEAILANLVMNRYLDDTEDEDGMVLLPMFLALRAAVRAHVTATQVAEADHRSEKLATEARSYFDLAQTLLRAQPPRLVAIGGLSGSGKSTVADRLAPQIPGPPGARVLESDRIRKALFDVPAETRLPQAAYRPEVSDEVYRTMALRAEMLLSSGVSVVADAVFDRPDTRAAMAAVARRVEVRFTGIWLEADPALLEPRVRAREDGPSDATLEVLAAQLARRADVLDWQRLPADAKPDATVSAILST